MWAVQIAVTGFVAGHSFLPNVWLHLGWLLVAGLPALAWTNWTPHLKRWKADAGTMSVFAFLSWMTVSSCIQIFLMPGRAMDEIIRGIIGTSLLVMFCALVWQQSRDREFLDAMGWVTSLTAALAALISIVLSYFLLSNHHAGERLTNLLVHGGLNPVCTGLIFGFAGLWLAALTEHEFTPLPRRLAWAGMVLLHFATFLSGSRGAMLALACGHAVLLHARGWRRGAAAACVFLMTGTIYFTSAPLLVHLNQKP